jgi:hypothetical protein
MDIFHSHGKPLNLTYEAQEFMSFRSATFQLSLVIILSLALSGCITANTSIIVNPDGSGELTASIGFPAKFIALMSSKDIDPVSELRKTLFRQVGHKVKFDQWQDNEFEWLQLLRPFDSVDELNDFAVRQSFIESFHLKHQRHFLKDQFIIDARFQFDQSSNPFMDVMSEDQTFQNFNTDVPIDSKISLRLPGRILETNGKFDNSTKTILWETNDTNTVEIHAISEKWNMSSLAITIVLGALTIVLIATIVILLMRIRKRRKPKTEDEVVSQRLVESIQVEPEEIESTPQADRTPVIPPSKILAMIGARELLDQVNTHVLNNRGNISVGKGAIRLVWRDQRDESVTRGLMITVQDAETILINGVPFPATREAARQGLISCLKGMTNQ